MVKPKQFHVTAEGEGDRGHAHYLIAAQDEDEARERVQATEFALWMASRTTGEDDDPTGREGQSEPYRVTSVESE